MRRALVGFLLATLATATLLLWVDQPLRTAAAPHGILSFEFAGEAFTASAILSSWDAAARRSAELSLGLDALFPLLYATTLGLALWLRGAPRLARAQAIAGGLDLVENAALLAILQGDPQDGLPQLAFACATGKMFLLAWGLLALLMLPWRRRR